MKSLPQETLGPRVPGDIVLEWPIPSGYRLAHGSRTRQSVGHGERELTEACACPLQTDKGTLVLDKTRRLAFVVALRRTSSHH